MDALHEVLEALRDSPASFRGEHCHQLLKWFEGATYLELLLIILLYLYITQEGGIMIRIVPPPRLHSLVVVQTDPAQSLDVGLTDPVLEFYEVKGSYFELLCVELLFVIVDFMGEL